MKRLVASLALICVVLTHAQAHEITAELTIGSPAPELHANAWYNGKAIEKFRKGQVYVIEFWATWCGPCMKTIPHMNELQKKYPNVTFVGVASLEQGPPEKKKSSIEKFLKAENPKIDYLV